MKLRTLLMLMLGLHLPGPAPAQAAPDRTVLLGTGKSMLPTLPEECRLVVVRIPFGQVRVGATDGDIVATRIEGLNVVHRAVGRRADGSLVTRGDNNPEADALATTERNYVGVVRGFEGSAEIGQLLVPAARRIAGD